MLRAALFLGGLVLALAALGGAAITFLYVGAPLSWAWWIRHQPWADAVGLGDLPVRVFEFRAPGLQKERARRCREIELAIQQRQDLPWWVGRWGDSLCLAPDGDVFHTCEPSSIALTWDGHVTGAAADEVTVQFRSFWNHFDTETYVRVRSENAVGLAEATDLYLRCCNGCIYSAIRWRWDSAGNAAGRHVELPSPYCEYVERRTVPAKIAVVEYEFLRTVGPGEYRLDWGGWIDVGASDGMLPHTFVVNSTIPGALGVVDWVEAERSYIKATQFFELTDDVASWVPELGAGEWLQRHDCDKR